MAHIIFDIGGTKMRVAKKLSDTEFMQPKKVETPKDGKDGIRVLIEHAKECAGEEGIESMSGGIAGILNGTKIINSSNLTGWIGIDFAEVSEEYGFPVRVENDSSVVGLGEAHFGAGKGKRIVTYITVSTGVGGARIVEGEIDKSAHGFEPGHQIIDRNGFKTLEDLVSGRSLEERFSKKPYEIIEEEVWKELALTLAVGLHNTIVHWSPDRVVLGGPMMVGTPSIPLDIVTTRLHEISHIFKVLPEIVLADLKDDGGLYGALVLARK